jgi:virginiamycin A acetyltransferase
VHDYTKLAVQHPLYERLLSTEAEDSSEGPITVSNDVWIGANALILSGVDIGDGAVIAGKSVVTDDVEPYSVVAGVPAEHKHYRFSEAIRERLLEIEWWNWNESKIKDNASMFQSSIESVGDLPAIE